MQENLTKADIVIIGAGVMGANIAWQLSQNSNKSIVVIDQATPVGGMSARTFGQVRLHYSNELTLRMALHGVRFFKGWSNNVGFGSSGYNPIGYLLLVVKSQLDALHRNIALAASVGINTEFVNQEGIKKIEPSINTQGLVGGVWDSAGGFIDVDKIVLSLLLAAQQHGVKMLYPARVTAIDHRNGRVTGVYTDRGRIEAGQIVAATGSWINQLYKPFSTQLPIETRRLDTMYLRQPAGAVQIGCCITDGNSNVAIRPDMGRDILVGAYPQQMPLASTPDQECDDRSSLEHLTRIRQSLSERLPELANAVPIRSVSGTYDITPDWHPVIDWAPDVDGLMLVSGFSGHGLKLSPAVGECVSAMLLGKTPPFDLHPLRLSRFDENDLMYCAYGPGARA